VQRCQEALALNTNDWVLHQKLAQLLEQSADKTWQTRAIPTILPPITISANAWGF
jgi:hypothetical protein